MVYSRLLEDFCHGNASCQAYSTVYLFLVAAFATWGVVSAVSLGFYVAMRSWRRQTRRSRVDPLTRLDAACEEMRDELSRHVDNSQVVKGLECLVNTAPVIDADPACNYCDKDCTCDNGNETRPENPIREALSKPSAMNTMQIDDLPPCTFNTFSAVQPLPVAAMAPAVTTDAVTTDAVTTDPVTTAINSAFMKEAKYIIGQQEKIERARHKSAEDALKNNPLFRLVTKNLEISRCQRVNDEEAAKRLVAERDQAISELPFSVRTRMPVRVDETINELTRLQLQIENTVDADELTRLRNKRTELRNALRASKKQQLDEDAKAHPDD